MKLNGCWDYPPLEMFGNPVSRDHIIPLHGWVVGKNPKVSIYVDDNLIDQIKSSSYREDIEIIFPHESKKMKNLCGWNYGLSTKNYSNDYHKITVCISDSSGLLSLGERSIDFGKQNKPIDLDNFLIDGYKKSNNKIYFNEADHEWLSSSSSSFGYSDYAKKIISERA